ncbi:HAMP domain-containing sensor histidine kinase [Clostridium sp. BJN0001]|uniref:sensor histidine kinase n=1 Tax=Clostridium sp. BJN0001 TaxID=2930219 RepID=UPI0032AF4F42
MKKKIKNYISGIYLIDILILFLIFNEIVAHVADSFEIKKIPENFTFLDALIILVIFSLYIAKFIYVFKYSKKKNKIRSRLIKNFIFIFKNGFKYKETKRTLIISITIAIFVLISYLYFLATGGRENNIFVKLFKMYPFKGSILMLAVIIISILYGLKKTLDIVVVNSGLKKFTEGDLNANINLQGSPAVNELIKNINLIQKGYKETLHEGVKNEKLKTELISNVSHDLKTPLTSIINYVNILKNEDITDEEKKEYLAILDKKSLRLKSLIEDLFEMSKINSGKMKLDLVKIDILSLIHQGIGEYSNLYPEKNIKFKVNSKDESIFMKLDGRLMSRTIENIIINALKYSLNNTRVYIDVKDHEKYVEISFKNVSQYEMDFEGNEMFERFARGDKSRNSKVEGSGLGLAIIKSIIELHKGTVHIRTEGDMFKIYIILPKNKEKEKESK